MEPAVKRDKCLNKFSTEGMSLTAQLPEQRQIYKNKYRNMNIRK